ncbi:putative RNA-binding protein [Lucilia cuprina]|uniref:Putative RNA-binding protein n=1 Tax=Lucilia cuprina TaxID=7375 RepID=A0A0L0CL17_LUCCU|nr:putative RNA-binding protein [Lucilia cuprina]KNC32922.1 putative RNA-binding protein [Lucilia cuprina]
MESSRFFVANLPTNTTEKDLRNLFQDYGPITNIELKTKENLVDPDDIKVIAFVTLNIGAEDAKYSLNDLNWMKVHGQQIKVSLAKESFLERLKREREEAKGVNDGSLQAHEQPFESQSELLKAPRENKRKTFDVDAELDDDEVAPELMISKKRAASSMHNGRIVIQSLDVQPLHVIETKHKKKKQLDKNSSSADQKRKESLNKMKNQYQQNKTAIQQALQGLDGQSSKKIKFSDAESDEEVEKPQETIQKSKTDIFGSDDDDEENDLNFKSVPLGKKGEKLVKMQATQSLDPRFRIDAKFVDDDEEGDENEADGKNGEKTNEDEVDNERDWQMNILEQVVGTKLDTVRNADKTQKNKKMLRYDPSKDEHQKFERSREEDAEIKKGKQKQSKIKDSAADDEGTKSGAPAEVSKEVFYVVTDTLQQSLRTRGEGFSLLNMFGNNEQLEQRDEQLKQLGNEKILVNNKLEKTFAVNPFSYDSSSESENEDTEKDQENLSPKEDEKAAAKKSKKKPKIATESFFIPKNDIRLKEGSKFFIYKKTDEASTENYEEVRNRLKLLIKTKITKTKKNLANAGYKGKRKV